MPFGLTHTDYRQIKSVFLLYPKVEEVIIFGSRALSTDRPGSDIDLALKGMDVSLDDILNINHALEELPLAYKYDIINYHKINTPELIKHIDTHGILFYKKEMTAKTWKMYRLGDISTKIGDGLHGTPKYDDNGEYYFINGSNLVNGKIIINHNTKKVAKEEFDKYKKDLSDNSILLGINGTIGNVALYNNEKCILGKSACYMNVNRDFDKYFVKYVLLNNHFQDFIKINATGTTIKNISLQLLRNYEVPCPDLPTQQRIASILSSLDDKIELNLQMNQTLENMAQTLFQEMCVPKGKELPEGWRKGKLGEIYKTTSGGTPSRSQNEYLKSKKDFLKNIAIGAAQQNISQVVIQNMEIKIPPVRLLSKFHTFAKVIYSKIKSNQQEIQTLTQLRDSLLPKLMRGEIKV